MNVYWYTRIRSCFLHCVQYFCPETQRFNIDMEVLMKTNTFNGKLAPSIGSLQVAKSEIKQETFFFKYTIEAYISTQKS